MSQIIQEILTSVTSLNDEDASFSLALYFALDIDNRFYHYQAKKEEKFIIELVEFYINRLAAVDIYDVNMFSKRPIHLLRFRQPFVPVKTTLAFYSNGAVGIDQSNSESTVHVWIQKDLVELYEIPKPQDLD